MKIAKTTARERGNANMWLRPIEEQVIEAFWASCGEPETFPRNLERSVALALPLSVVKLPRLTISLVKDWLEHRGAGMKFACTDRHLRGCLVAYRGQGIIFADGADCEAELRFTIAHEVAHFLVDYLRPRSAALSAFGDSMREVVDGLREPMPCERLHALFAAKTVRLHVNLMERSKDGDTNFEIRNIEDRADRVGLALLAPPAVVVSGLGPLAPSFLERHRSIATELSSRFGLPDWIACAYSRALLVNMGCGPTWVEALKKR